MLYNTQSIQQTRQLAEKIAKQIKTTGAVIALCGKLGAGKTTFTQGFAQGLGITQKIISPTYILIRQYPLPHSDKHLFHLDLYRLDKISDIKALGIEELFQTDNIILIEWAEKIKAFLPSKTIYINIDIISSKKRTFKIKNLASQKRHSRRGVQHPS